MLRNQARGNLISQWLHQIDYHYDISNQLDTVRFSSWAAVDTFIVFGYNTSGERISKNYIRNWKDSCGGVQQGMMGPLGGGATSGSGGGGVPGDPDRGRLCDYMDTTLTWYVRGKGKVLAEYAGAYAVAQHKYIYAGDRRIAMIDRQGVLHYYLNDHLGSVRVVLTAAGAVNDSLSYWAFGDTRVEQTNTGQDYK
ncbi:MAG: hypothetical protein ACE5FH_11060, partial [Candidatus Zixiibacteriota bacterium]